MPALLSRGAGISVCRRAHRGWRLPVEHFHLLCRPADFTVGSVRVSSDGVQSEVPAFSLTGVWRERAFPFFALLGESRFLAALEST
jgi:hypothetical protein